MSIRPHGSRMSSYNSSRPLRGVGECTAAWRTNPRFCYNVDATLCRSLSAFGQVGLAVDSRGDVALAGHVFEDDGGFLDGRRDAIVLKLASGDGSTLWTRCRYYNWFRWNSYGLGSLLLKVDD